MTRRAHRSAHDRPLPDGPAPFTTLVELTFEKRKVEHWIRFGRKSYEQIIDRRRSVVGFAPNNIFAFVRWAAGEHGTIISRIDIARATGRGEPFQTLPFVRPGGDILLRLDGWPKVQRALAVIDAVEALGLDPADVSPETPALIACRYSCNSTRLACAVSRMARRWRASQWLTMLRRCCWLSRSTWLIWLAGQFSGPAEAGMIVQLRPRAFNCRKYKSRKCTNIVSELAA